MSFIRKLHFAIVLAAVCVFASGLSAEAKLTRKDAYAVWNKVAQAADLTSLPFTIEDEKEPNAWVTEGESVTVTTGLLNLLETRAELYGVLAHEAGHAKLNHHEDTLSQMAGLKDTVAAIEDIFAAFLSAVFGSDIAEVAGGVGAHMVEAAWSRAQEVEAENYAVKLVYENKEDLVAVYSATQRLSAFDGEQEPNAFNTHPLDERLLLHMKNEILKYDPAATFPKPIKPRVR